MGGRYVCINDHKSQSKIIKYGVPRGFILGTLLFILYINDFLTGSSLLHKVLFADDTNLLLSSHKNVYDLQMTNWLRWIHGLHVINYHKYKRDKPSFFIPIEI